MNSELIEVYADWKNLQGPVLVGLLRFEEPLGKEIIQTSNSVKITKKNFTSYYMIS